MMETKQIALKLVLDAIGEDAAISSVDDRMRIQKAIYLSQVLGINTGYHYSWYLKGPYSTDLTQDYYKLGAAISGGDQSYASQTLNPALGESVKRIRGLLMPPANLGAAKPNWYEALASLHFLLCISKYSLTDAKSYLAKVKPHLQAYVDTAVQRLREYGLIPA